MAHRINLAIVRNIMVHIVIAVITRNLEVTKRMVVVPRRGVLMIVTSEVAVDHMVEVPVMVHIIKAMIAIRTVKMELKCHMEHKGQVVTHLIEDLIMVGMIIMAHLTMIEAHPTIVVIMETTEATEATRADLEENTPIET